MIIITSVSTLFFSSSDNLKTEWSKLISKARIKSTKGYYFNGIDKFGEIQKSDLDLIMVSTYNDKNKPVEEVVYESSGSIVFKNTYGYDSKGNMIEFKRYTSTGNLLYRDLNVSPIKNKTIEYNSISGDGKLLPKYICKIDENGNPFEKTYFQAEGEFDYKELIRYNENGDMIELISISSDNKVEYSVNYKYLKYDKEGNWLIMTVKGPTNKFIEREIEYYPKE